MLAYRTVTTGVIFTLLSLPCCLSAVPPAPLNLRVAFVTRNEVALEWDASSGATMYRVDYKESGSSQFQSLGPGAVFQQPSIRIGTLTQDVQYDVQVAAGNSDGWSANALLINDASVTPRNAPEPPINVAEGARTETSLTLVWDAPTNPPATHYRVSISECRKGLGQIECVEGAPCLNDRTVRCSDYSLYEENGESVEFSSPEAVIRSLTEGTTYFFYVESRNLNINGYQNGGSIPVRLVPRGPYMKAPTNLRVTGVERDAVHLEWDASAGATHYRVQFRRAVESAWNPIASDTQIVTTATVYVITRLTSDTEYLFRVMARDLFEETIGSGTVAWAGDDDGNAELDQHASNIVAATPVLPLSASPTGLRVTGFRETEVHLAWNSLSGANYYVVQVKATDKPYVALSFWADVVESEGVALRWAATTAVVSALTTGTQYEFRLKAYNQHIRTSAYNGYTGPSAAVIATPSARLPAPERVGLVPLAFEGLQQCTPSCVTQLSTTTHVTLDASSPAIDGLYDGAAIRLVTGPATDSVAEIAHYNGSSKVALLSQALPRSPGANSIYLLDRFPVGPHRATVTWAAVNGAERYRISRRRKGFEDDFSGEEVTAAPTASQGACRRQMPGVGQHPGLTWALTECWELVGLEEGVEYEVVVEAGNTHLEWGLPSQFAVIQPLHPPDESPSDPQVVVQDLDSVTMTWTPPRKSTAPTRYYRVSVREAGSGESWDSRQAQMIYTNQELGYVITGLPLGLPADIRVQAANDAGLHYPPLEFRLTTQVVDLTVIAARASECNGTYPSLTCHATDVWLGWTPPQYAQFFKLWYRLAGSSDAFQPIRSPVGPGTVVGPNVTQVRLNRTHIPLVSVGVEWEYKVVSSELRSGPYEDVGSRVVLAVTNRAPAPPTNVRIVSKTLASVTVSWFPSTQAPIATYFVVEVCYNATTADNCSVYPNSDVADKTSAQRFTDAQATVDLFHGVPLQPDTPYWIRVFACSFWDENGDGELTGNEGCEAQGGGLPLAAVPGGLAEPVTGLRVTETYPSILRLEWNRSGTGGNLATMYKVMQRRGEVYAGAQEQGQGQGLAGAEFEEVTRVLVRGAFQTCDNDFPSFVLRDFCVQIGTAVTYGRSTAVDNCGQDFCVSSFMGNNVLITKGPGEGYIRQVVEFAGADPKYLVLNDSYPGIDLRDPVSGTFNVIGQGQLGGPCCPIETSTVVAFVAGLAEGEAYQFKVLAGNANDGGFETAGSEVVTGYTIGRPNPVDDLAWLFLVGTDSVRVRWTDPGGPRFCGERVYRLLGKVAGEGAWREMNRTDVAWTDGYIFHTFILADGTQGVELTVTGLGIGPGRSRVVNTLMVETLCANHLPLANTSLPDLLFLEDPAAAGVDGVPLNITIQGPPTGLVERLAVIYVTRSSLFVTWAHKPLADRYRVQVANASADVALPFEGLAADGNFSSFSLWPSPSTAAIFFNPGTTIRELESGQERNLYKVQVQAGSQHGEPGGEYLALSNESRGYVPTGPVEAADLDVMLQEYTSTSVTVRWHTTPLNSIDPSDHSRPLYQIYLQRGLGHSWEGGDNFAGCSNVDRTDRGVLVPLSGVCQGMVVLAPGDGTGLGVYETTFTGLLPGVDHYIRIHTYNLFSHTPEEAVFAGTVWECICALPGGVEAEPGACPGYRLLGSTLPCSVSASHAYLDPPASTADGAYTSRYMMITGGTGRGQARKIIDYVGSERKAVISGSWDVAPDRSSQVLIYRAGFVELGRVTGAVCASGQCTSITIQATELRDGSGVASSVEQMFVEMVDGDCVGQIRLVTAYRAPQRSISLFPNLVCNVTVNSTYRVHNLSSISKTLGPISQSGPPLRTALPIALLVSHNSVLLEWEPTTLCDGGSLTILCSVSTYKVQIRQTHDSSDFPTPGEPWGMETLTDVPRLQFTGLSDMSSFEIRVAAKTALNSFYGDWSDSQFVKLTGGAPSLQSQIEDFEPSRYNDRILVKWSSTLQPKQIDRYYLTIGRPGFDSMEVADASGRRVVLLDGDVCTFESSTRAQCSYFVTGLEIGTIYVFQVFSGNMNGFETIGSNVGISSTLSLPNTPIPNLVMEGVIPSLDIDGYAVRMSWLRPGGFPVVTRYYVAQADTGGQFFQLPGVIERTDAKVFYTVTGLTKGTEYQFRVHGGNEQGPTGFHVDMVTDPTASSILSVTPDTVPGRVLILSAEPTTPDKNSMMLLTWQAPRAGAPANYFQISVASCLNNSAPSCVADSVGTVYTGCTSSMPFCTLNPNCDPAFTNCVAPCEGAANEGASAAGLPCRFEALEGRVTGLAKSTWYRFTMTAHNTAGSSAVSALFPTGTGSSVVPRTLSLPPAVTSLAVPQVTANTVVLSWNAIAPALCAGACIYKITWTPAVNGQSEVLGVRGNKYEHSVSWAAGSIAYQYRVFSGQASTNRYEEFGTGVTLPQAASNFRVTTATENSLSFAWNPSPPADTFQVFLSSGLAFRPASPETSVTSVRIEGLATGLAYDFKVLSRVAGKTVFEYLGSNTVRALPSGLGTNPENLRVTETTHSSVRLQWDNGAGQAPVRYKLVRQSLRNGAGFEFPIDSDVLKGGGMSTVVTDLAQDDEYAFKVFAGNFRGFEQVGSNIVAGVQPVGKPRDLSVRGVSSSSATLDWSPPLHGENPAAYRIEYEVLDSVIKIADVVHLGGRSSTQSALISSLQRNPHTFKVYSRADNGYYEPFGTQPQVGMPLLVPSRLRLVQVSTTTVTLEWDLPDELPPLTVNGTVDPNIDALVPTAFVPESYTLHYEAIGAVQEGDVEGISIYNHTWTVTGLVTNQPYSFQIQAKAPGGQLLGTLGSNSATATPMDTATDLAVVEVGATRVDLEWVGPAQGLIPASYAVSVVPTSGSIPPSTITVPHQGAYQTRQRHSVTGLANGQQYRFSVAVVAFTGDLGPSGGDGVTATTMAPPTDLAVSAVSPFSITLTWQPATSGPLDASPLYYLVQYTRTGFPSDDGEVQVPFGGSRLVLEGLVSGAEYALCLVAVAVTGDRVISRGATCPLAIPMGAPTAVRFVHVSPSSVTLEWQPPTEGQPPTAYLIQAQKESDGTVVSLEVGGTGGPWELGSLDGSAVWLVSVRSVIAGFVHPVGSAALRVSPVGRSTDARLCFLTQSEVALQWRAPALGPHTLAYGISVRPPSCGGESAECSDLRAIQNVEHQGAQSSVQRSTILNLQSGTDVELRIHTQNPQTLLYDPVGTAPIVVRPQGGRADFALAMPGAASESYAMVAPAADADKRDYLRTPSATVEAWVWLDPAAAVGYQGIAGNAYSYVAQSISSQGAGHFGYGLYCNVEDIGGGLVSVHCGFHVGTLTDPGGGTSLLGLCPSLGFPDARFCGGDPGYTRSHRAESGALQLGRWVHLGGSYSSVTGALILLVDGQLAHTSTVSYVAADGSIQHPQILYSSLDEVYPVSDTKPWHRTDWQIGRALMGQIAPTVATAPHAYLVGIIDEVRVWSSARSAQTMRLEAYLDTVAVGSAGLLGYWPMDEPTFGTLCSEETLRVRDASRANTEGCPGVLSGGANLVVSGVELDRDGQFSAETPLENAEIEVMVGEVLDLSVAGVDANPTDGLSLQLQLPSDPLLHPSGLTLLNTTEQSAVVTWRPLPRDSGKVVPLCFSLVNSPNNPLRPSFSRPGFSTERCITLVVPLCRYRAGDGESLRDIAVRYHTNWRALFLLNPHLQHPLDLEPGAVILVGSLYQLGAEDSLEELSARVRVPWTSLVNNNAALVYRLWSDHTFLETARTGQAPSQPIGVLDPGEGVYDVRFRDLEMMQNYSQREVCLVAQFNTNCF